MGDWIWGTVEGSFNEKQSISQMIVDAAIGMLPIVGDLTAIRDLIAVVMGLAEDPRKREDKLQWMLLVVLIFALIPVAGGVVKGAGRILIHVMGEVGKIAEKGAQTAHLLEKVRDIIAMANRLGVGNAEKWLKDLSFAARQNEIVGRINELLVRLDGVLGTVQGKLRWILPESVLHRVASLKENLAGLRAIVADHIPDAIKQLDEDLRKLQQLIYNGGETTSRTVSHSATAGAKNVSYTEELILLEGKGATRTARGGWAKNGMTARDVQRWNLTAWAPLTETKKASYPLVSTFSGQIVNREIHPGEKIFRVFGPAEKTHGVPVPHSFAGGSPDRFVSFWGVGDAPSAAERWQEGAAVLDEWNHDGFVIIGEVLSGHPPVRACTGVIAEQQGEKIGVQYLKGGDKQAMLELPADVKLRLNEWAAEVEKTGKTIKGNFAGISRESRPTGWPDANGIYGYLHMPGPATVQTVRLGAREIASKRDQQRSN